MMSPVRVDDNEITFILLTVGFFSSFAIWKTFIWHAKAKMNVGKDPIAVRKLSIYNKSVLIECKSQYTKVVITIYNRQVSPIKLAIFVPDISFIKQRGANETIIVACIIFLVLDMGNDAPCHWNILYRPIDNKSPAVMT